MWMDGSRWVERSIRCHLKSRAGPRDSAVIEVAIGEATSGRHSQVFDRLKQDGQGTPLLAASARQNSDGVVTDEPFAAVTVWLRPEKHMPEREYRVYSGKCVTTVRVCGGEGR